MVRVVIVIVVSPCLVADWVVVIVLFAVHEQIFAKMADKMIMVIIGFIGSGN